MGTEHQVYNHPASEFVARFMGGHNVVRTTGRTIAVRNDHMHIAFDGDGLPGTVTDVEYQGTYVLLALKARDDAGEQNFSVMVPEAAFRARPFKPGDAVALSWPAERGHPLPA